MSQLSIHSNKKVFPQNSISTPAPTPYIIFNKAFTERILSYLSPEDHGTFSGINITSLQRIFPKFFLKVNRSTGSAFCQKKLFPNRSWAIIRASIINSVKNKLKESEEQIYTITSFKDYFGDTISLQVLKGDVLSIGVKYRREIRISSEEVEYHRELCPLDGSSFILCLKDTIYQVKPKGTGANFVISPHLPNIEEAPHMVKTTYAKNETLKLYHLEQEFARYRIVEEDGIKYKKYDKPDSEGVELSQEEYETNKHLKGYFYTYLATIPPDEFQKDFIYILDCFLYNFNLVKKELSEKSTFTNNLVKNLIDWTSYVPSNLHELIKNLRTGAQVVKSTKSKKEAMSNALSIEVWNKRHGRNNIYAIAWEKTKGGISLKMEKKIEHGCLGGNGSRTCVLENNKRALKLKIVKKNDSMDGSDTEESFYTITGVKGNWKFSPEGYTSESLSDIVIIDPTQKSVSPKMSSNFSKGIQTQEKMLEDMHYYLRFLYTLSKLLSDRQTIIIDNAPNSGSSSFKEIRTIRDEAVSNIEELREYIHDSCGTGNLSSYMYLSLGIRELNLSTQVL